MAAFTPISLDGGFTYVAAVARKPGAKNDDGPPPSYASMTYAGLQSLIYAGLTRDDSRVKAAIGRIRQRYTLDENPGLPNAQQGLYYYPSPCPLPRGGGEG